MSRTRPQALYTVTYGHWQSSVFNQNDNTSSHTVLAVDVPSAIARAKKRTPLERDEYVASVRLIEREDP